MLGLQEKMRGQERPVLCSITLTTTDRASFRTLPGGLAITSFSVSFVLITVATSAAAVALLVRAA